MEMLDVIKKLQEIAQQEVAPPGREKQVKALKGKVDNPYAVAWSSYNKSKGKKEAIGDELADEGGFKDIDTAKSEKARLYALLKDKKEKYNATMAGQLDYDEGELQDEIQKIERALGISDESTTKEQFGAKMHDTLNINGMTTDEDVISMIQDTIDAGKGNDAKDYLEQFKKYLFSKAVPQSEAEGETTIGKVAQVTVSPEQMSAYRKWYDKWSKLDTPGNIKNYADGIFYAYMDSGTTDLDAVSKQDPNKEAYDELERIFGTNDIEAIGYAIDKAEDLGHESTQEDETGAFEDTKELNTKAMTTEDKKPINESKKPVKEAITMSADTPEEAGMLMQIMKLAGVQQVTPDMIGAEEPTVAPDAEVPADNDADAEADHNAEGHDHSTCPVCGDDAVGSNEMGRMRDMVSQNDGGDQAEETFANEPDEKIDDVDTLVNVHSGGLNRQKQQVKKEYPGDNPLAVKEDPTEEELSNSLRTQYEGFKKSYQEATKVTETHKGKSHKGKDHDKDGDVDSKDYMKSKDIAIKKAMKK